jgi:YbgC/YbaW family acyl-CoA thioester hydrolase
MKTALKKSLAYAVTVQFEDVDAYRIAHHTKLIAYLERARVHWFLQQGYSLDTAGCAIVLYSLDMVFKKPARFLDELTVTVGVTVVEGFRMTLGYRVCKDSILIAEAASVLVFVEPASGEPLPVPTELQV